MSSLTLKFIVSKFLLYDINSKWDYSEKSKLDFAGDSAKLVDQDMLVHETESIVENLQFQFDREKKQLFNIHNIQVPIHRILFIEKDD